MIEILITFCTLCIGYGFGTYLEKRHYKSIREREASLVNLITDNTNKNFTSDVNCDASLVMGSAVISIDYFKRFLASLVNIFGGRVTAYETLVDRARREALLRMKEQAVDADKIVNVRIETSTVGAKADSKRGLGSIEVLAFGTAIYLEKKQQTASGYAY